MNEHTGNMGFDASSSSGFVSKICLLEIPIWLGMTLFSQMGRRFIAFGLFNGSIFVNNTFFSIHDSPNTIYIQCHSSEPKYNKRLYLIWAEKKGKIDFFFLKQNCYKSSSWESAKNKIFDYHINIYTSHFTGNCWKKCRRHWTNSILTLKWSWANVVLVFIVILPKAIWWKWSISSFRSSEFSLKFTICFYGIKFILWMIGRVRIEFSKLTEILFTLWLWNYAFVLNVYAVRHDLHTLNVESLLLFTLNLLKIIQRDLYIHTIRFNWIQSNSIRNCLFVCLI